MVKKFSPALLFSDFHLPSLRLLMHIHEVSMTVLFLFIYYDFYVQRLLFTYYPYRNRLSAYALFQHG